MALEIDGTGNARVVQGLPGRIERREQLTYIVPAGTVVMVADKSMVLREHRTRKENRFTAPIPPAQQEPKLALPHKSENPPVMISPTDIDDVGYHTFDTGNENWPYMVVAKTFFRANVLRASK